MIFQPQCYKIHVKKTGQIINCSGLIIQRSGFGQFLQYLHMFRACGVL
jgi:hypothetical protein